MNLDVSLKKRKLTNFMLQPLLQTKIGLYCILISFIFAVLLGIVIYLNMRELFDFIIEMTDAPFEVHRIIESYLGSMQAWVYLCLTCYVIVMIALSIWYTHRLVGPTVAFRRHLEAIDAGDYTHRTILRKHDAFVELADKLNEVSENMAKRKK